MGFNKMTEREQQVYQQIVKNPYVSQQKLSETLQLSRSTVANLISALVQKNILLGRAYVLNESRQITCIGGANVDRKLHSQNTIQLETSNPVYASYSAGGVARNIAENLARLGFLPNLITTAGRDADWGIIENASSMINLDAVLNIPHAATGSYTAVLNPDGDLVVALADMNVFEAIRPELIVRNERMIKQSQCLVADLNCPKDTLSFLIRKAEAMELPLALISVSAPKMERLPDDLAGLTWLMTNVEETEAYFNISIDSQDQWRDAVQRWLDKGIEGVTVTCGYRGVMAGHKDEGIFYQAAPSIDKIKDVTGAGDAFASGVIYAWLDGMDMKQVIRSGIANAVRCLQSSASVRQDLTPALLHKDLEELA